MRTPHRPRCAVAGVALALAALAVAPLRAAVPSQVRGAGPVYVWKDPDGNPLPFQADEEIIEFLRTAEIVSARDIELGVTGPRRVTLQRNGVRMRAALRDYDETYTESRFDGIFYARLRDSYVFDIPAYKLSRLLEINIPPVTLRRISGTQISLQAWVEGALMESDRIERAIEPPSVVEFRRQTQDMRVFDSVIGNVDRNSGNILYDEDFDVWLIDHSRAFMRNDDTRYLPRITGCSRKLYERLQTLTFEQLEPLLSPPLTDSEVRWVLRRRDKVIEHIDVLIAERGEGAVLFESGQ
ncbi:MAG: hypothetical protein PVJ49_12525 [Acidobacteriota bacterium]|jgi:hypothetical protein